MPKFKDTKGREWSLALNIAVAKRVREEVEVDLLGRDLLKTLERLFGDHILLCDVLYVVANENAETGQRVTGDEFGRALSGDVIEEGEIALLRAITDFTPSPRARERVGKMIEAVIDGVEKVHDQADEAIDKALVRMREDLSGGTSSSSPPSQESSLGGTPSES